MSGNWPSVYERYGGASFTLSDLLSTVVGQFQTQALLDDAQTFFDGKDVGTAKLALKQAYETVQINMFWLNQRMTEFATELNARMPN
jgi:hypothetical protein